MCLAKNYSEDILTLYHNINADFNRLSHELSQADLMEQDILHLIEKGGFNACEGYNLSKQLFENRKQRRKVKNEWTLLRKLKQSFIDMNMQGLKETHESIVRKDKILKNLTENKVYNPRVLRPNTNVKPVHKKVV